MSAELQTRSSVESIPAGERILSFVNIGEGWLEEQRPQRVNEAVDSVINEIHKTIPFCIITRLVEVAPDFQSEVFRWQRELGEPEGVTSDSYGEAHGKTLVWGNGDLESTYAVIILSELFSLSLIEGGEKNQALSKAVLSHELAHVHDEFLYRRIFHQPPPTDEKSWMGLRRTLAFVVWSEFFANTVAYHYHKILGIDEAALIPVALIPKVTSEITKRIARYRFDGNIPKLWYPSVSDMSHIFAQSARSLGLIVAAENDGVEKLSELFVLCDQVLPAWGHTIRRLSEELRQNLKEPQTPQMLQGIEVVIEDGFHAVGLYPKDPETGDAGKGIWVGVP